MQSILFQNPALQRLKTYYLSILSAYLLVPITFIYMSRSFATHGYDPNRLHIGHEVFFMRMMLVGVLAAVAVIPLFALWLAHCLNRAGLHRQKLDLFFASAPIGIPVFFFALGWINSIH